VTIGGRQRPPGFDRIGHRGRVSWMERSYGSTDPCSRGKAESIARKTCQSLSMVMKMSG
jgi:hypothetical protein